MNNDEILEHLNLQTDIPECSMSESDCIQQTVILNFKYIPDGPHITAVDIVMDMEGNELERTIHVK